MKIHFFKSVSWKVIKMQIRLYVMRATILYTITSRQKLRETILNQSILNNLNWLTNCALKSNQYARNALALVNFVGRIMLFIVSWTVTPAEKPVFLVDWWYLNYIITYRLYFINRLTRGLTTTIAILYPIAQSVLFEKVN